MLLKKRFVRFGIVGIINTLIDVPIFMFLRNMGMTILVSNIFSTSAALTASYILNHKFTFKSQGDKKYKFVPFIVVTLVGLWILQPLAIRLLIELNQYLHYTEPFQNTFGPSINFEDLLSKLASVSVTLIWNYVWYSKIIFAKSNRADGEDSQN